ncbi:MAG TPA: branched-chain amino acid ABC transporter permease [Acetobacteraceae bacterium]|nr:branched-chain amino acid ABC transporter permease [Acetobacteraceae bacterium]
MMPRSRSLAIVAILIVAALVLLPFVAEKFTVQFATRILIMAMFAMSLNLLVGHAGLVSLGHAAYFGIAGYCLALASQQSQAANFWTSLPLVMIAAGALALVIGALVLRTGGIYFIMATLAFAQMLYFLLHDTGIAGGSDGMYIYARPDASLFGWRPIDLERFGDFYFVVLALFVVVFGFIGALRASLFGRVLAGIRVNEQRMRSLGFATFRYKLACFVLAGMLAGLAGYLAAVQFGVVNPDMLGWQLSGAVLMMVILGGMGTLAGPVIGAAAMLLLELGLQSLPALGDFNPGKHWQLSMGIVIVLVALFLPEGITRLLRRTAADG